MANDIQIDDVTIRPATPDDVMPTFAIARVSCDRPWDKCDFEAFVKSGNCIATVAENDERVIGFMAARKDDSELMLCEIAVVEAYRHRGVATSLFDKLTATLHPGGPRGIEAIGLWTDDVARSFLTKLGFRSVEMIQDDLGTDAFLFEWTLRAYREIENARES